MFKQECFIFRLLSLNREKKLKPPFHRRLLNALCYFFFFSLLSSCGDQKAKSIVDAGIEAHGGSAYQSFLLEFDFRDIHYTAARDGGIFSYTREFTDSTGRIKDVLNNSGFTRYRNDSPLTLTKGRAGAFTRSVNSVIYFALLPFGLNDDAVIKKWIKETTIKGEPYDVVRVTFHQTSGGDDHDDVFLYWFHQEKNTMDYLAYSYKTDGGGLRFREALNPRTKGGMLLQDYINYKPADETVPLDDLEAMFVSGDLQKFSNINLENTSVTAYPGKD